MATVKKSKFESALSMSHKDIKGKRAKIFTTDAEIDSNDYIRVLTDKSRELERILMNLEDFHADSTTTLHVTTSGFNSKEWIKEMNETKVSLKLVKERIEIARDIHKEYFM